MFNVALERSYFPILNTNIKQKPLIYLDNAASTQKPQIVLDAMHEFYSKYYSNVHRGIYALSEAATERFENARVTVQNFIGANQTEEIIFTRGATEAINLVAQSYLRPRLEPGDEILISQMEHHANIVPFQQLCEQTGAVLKVIPLNEDGSLNLAVLDTLLHSKTRLVAITHLSNVLGILNPIEKVITQAHQKGIPVLIDGAQAISHVPVDVKALDCDFYTFSGHKMYGPNSIGVLYGKLKHLEKMPPWQGGGGMIRRVSFERIEYAEPPYRFEAGTPAITEAIGLKATVNYLEQLDWKALINYEKELYRYALDSLKKVSGLTIFAQEVEHRLGSISICLDKVHAHDIATILNEEGIAVRAGHHCAMPLMEWLGVAATARVSLGLYNTDYEVDALVKGLKKAQKLFA